MNPYILKIAVKDGEIDKILKDLTKAQETIYQCYRRLEELGVLVIDKAAETENAAG